MASDSETSDSNSEWNVIVGVILALCMSGCICRSLGACFFFAYQKKVFDDITETGVEVSATIDEKNVTKNDKGEEKYVIGYTFMTEDDSDDDTPQKVEVQGREINKDLHNKLSQGGSAAVLYVPGSPGLCRLKEQHELEKGCPCQSIAFYSFALFLFFCALGWHFFFNVSFGGPAMIIFLTCLACNGLGNVVFMIMACARPYGGDVKISPVEQDPMIA
mmetsp:Transcript_64649/g.142597  ORF Transcript_64649/g.142597 Transcript_64649/m.142597 type:complete len:218 (+) Transcript_64649:71-724(+)